MCIWRKIRNIHTTDSRKTKQTALYLSFPLHHPQLFHPRKPLANCLKILALQITVFRMGQEPGMGSDGFNPNTRETKEVRSLSSRPLGLVNSSQDYLVILSLEKKKKKKPYHELWPEQSQFYYRHVGHFYWPAKEYDVYKKVKRKQIPPQCWRDLN